MSYHMKYEKTQTGWMFNIIFVVIIISILMSYLFQLGNHPLSTNGLLVVSGILLLTLFCFYRLKIKIEHQTIHIIYGIGLIHIRLKPTAISAVRVIKTTFYAGYGIRITPTGMLYNIQGSKAVEITYGNERRKTVKIGSAEAEVLKQAILHHFKDELLPPSILNSQ